MTPEQLAELAMEIESEDPIEWGMLAIPEEEVFLQMATQTINMMNKYDMTEREVILMAGMVKLLAENFALHTQLIRGF